MGYMIEGGGSKTLSNAKKWLYRYPDDSHTLLSLLTNVIIDYFVMQVEAGAQILQLFDSSAEYLNKDLYDIFGIPYLKKIREDTKLKLHQLNLPEVPMVFNLFFIPLHCTTQLCLQVLFAKGASFCLKEQADLGYEVLGVDWTVKPKEARKVLQDKNVTLQGNLDPCALYAPKEKIKEYTERMIENFGCNKYIVNLGHGIYPDADVEAVQAFIDAVHDFKVPNT